MSKLSSIRYIDKHLRERKKRHPGSGSWLKETLEFKDWMAADCSACLWCYGIRKSELACCGHFESNLKLTLGLEIYSGLWKDYPCVRLSSHPFRHGSEITDTTI